MCETQTRRESECLCERTTTNERMREREKKTKYAANLESQLTEDTESEYVCEEKTKEESVCARVRHIENGASRTTNDRR